METTLNAAVINIETAKVGDLIYTSEMANPVLCLVIAEMDRDGKMMTVVLNPSEGMPFVFYLDKGDEVLSFGSQWVLKPNFSMSDCNETQNWRRHHLVIGRGGLHFQVRGERVTDGPTFIPVSGKTDGEPAKRRMAPVICRGYEIYSSRAAMEQGERPLHLIDQSDFLSK